MTFTSSAGRLPVELLSMIADCLDIQGLLTLSHVCARWYAVGRAHPTFWRDIRLAAVSEPALELFQQRLETAAGRRVYLDLCIAGHPFCDRIRDVVIPAITRSLCHTVQLMLDMHSTTAPHVIPALVCPAPLLESMGLQFFYHPKGQPVVTLPSNLLAGACPRLADIALANVGFPVEPVLVFQNVHSVAYHFGRRRIIPAGMFDHFPALQNLIILGHSRLRVQSIDGPAPSLTVRPLDELQLSLTRCDYDQILSSFPNLASAKHIVCRQPRENVAQQLVNQLRAGPLDLSFLCLTDDLVHIALHERPTDRVRSLAELKESVIDDMPRGVLFAPHLLERYETLRIFAQLGYLAPHIEALPRCGTLEVILDSDLQSPLSCTDISAALRLPDLRAVVVGNGQERSSGIINVDAGKLRTYLSQLLGVRTKRPSLKLHGVTVTGDRDVLFQDFDELAG